MGGAARERRGARGLRLRSPRDYHLRRAQRPVRAGDPRPHARQRGMGCVLRRVYHRGRGARADRHAQRAVRNPGLARPQPRLDGDRAGSRARVVGLPRGLCGVRMKNDFRARHHPAYWAFIVHRASGVLLALFLPFHFWALGQALQGEQKLESFLRWTDQPLVKAGETALVLLLAAHMTGGLRLLALEFLAWRDWQKSLLAVAAGVALAAGLAFLLNLA